MLGLLEEGEIFRSRAKGSPSFADDLRSQGGVPERIDDAVRDASSFKAFFELHIEQGNLLESRGISIGAVTGIVGIYRYIVTIAGDASHAGTTPMSLRDDALVKAAPLFTLLPEWVAEQNEEMVGTIGQLRLEPGVVNVIPGECTFIVELRSMKPKDMSDVRDRIKAWVADRKGSTVSTIYEKDSVALSDPMIEIISSAADMEGLPRLRMPSGAGHDAQSFAPHVPTGMIFVPCRKGKSHSPEEWSEPQQVADGCRVLIRSILELANKTKGQGG
jgi:hydantoinase/carbamoylase family amidase